MIVPDINLLVYAHNEATPLHAPAREWWTEALNGEESVGIAWASLFGFVRLTTHPAVMRDPIRPADALRRTRTWLERPRVRILDPGARHLDIVAELFRATGVAGRLTTDTHLAALAIEHQAVLHSNDADFARFAGLRWTDPLR